MKKASFTLPSVMLYVIEEAAQTRKKKENKRTTNTRLFENEITLM